MSAAATTPFTAAHRTYVKTLYRHALKDALDWYVRRDLWRNRAIEIRAMFERDRDVRDPRRVAAMLQQVESNLNKYRHPDPYRPPMAPDGTKWERNIPPRMHTQEHEHAAVEAAHID